MHTLELRSLSLWVGLSLVLAGCGSDPSGESGSETSTSETSDSDASTTPGDGDGDEPGDGDGDPAAGDGDGDASGDGDGDEPGDGDGDEPEGGEGVSCGSILLCVQGCGDDLDCLNACQDAGSDNAVGEFGALSLCLFENNCSDEACSEENCGPELFACYTGDDTCSDLLGCVSTCEGEQTCNNDCYFNATSIGQGQLDALSMCDGSNGCNGGQACLEENCAPELAGCVGGNADTLPCPVVVACVFECGGEALCEAGCGPATPEQQGEADGLLECAQMNDCEDFDCASEACTDDFVACVSGEASCSELLACMGACAGNELCEYNCDVGAELMAQETADAVSVCAQDNGCALDDADCLMNSCADALAQCD